MADNVAASALYLSRLLARRHRNLVLHTTVDDGDHFEQILAWTIKARWQQQKEQLREIIRTFRGEK